MAGVDEQSKTRSFWLGLVSLLGAAGTGLQNYMAFFTFLASVTRFGWDLLQGLAISLGGICSGLVNLFINIDLLNKFAERFYPLTQEGKKKKQARDAYHTEHLKPWSWNWLKYWLGIAVFISTGVLFGLTALSFSAVGVLTAIAIAAGIFVSIIMVAQELETWLEAFDPPGTMLYKLTALLKEYDRKYYNTYILIPASQQFYHLDEAGKQTEIEPLNKEALMQIMSEGSCAYLTENQINAHVKLLEPVLDLPFWKKLSTWFGSLIAVGNVLALSLLFTVGLAVFLVTVGISPLTAVISGLCIAFTIGAFTEFYFYNFFLADFCANIEKKWKDLLNSKYWGLGLFSISANAAVNAAVCYASVPLLNPILVAGGLAPLPLVVPIVAAIFGGLASLLLGADFWIGNCEKVVNGVGSVLIMLVGDGGKSLSGMDHELGDSKGSDPVPPSLPQAAKAESVPLIQKTETSDSLNLASVVGSFVSS